MLYIKDALRKEGTIYIFKCSSCDNEIKSKTYYLFRHSGKCVKCSHRKPAFQHIFNKFKSSAYWEKKKVTISFKDFLKFTTIDQCHYCYEPIKWNPYPYINGKLTDSSYYLDRKNNRVGYHKDNIVVCCTKCNRAKGDRYSYKDWYGMTEYLRNKKQ